MEQRVEAETMQTRFDKKMAARKAAGRKGIFIYITAEGYFGRDGERRGCIIYDRDCLDII